MDMQQNTVVYSTRYKSEQSFSNIPVQEVIIWANGYLNKREIL